MYVYNIYTLKAGILAKYYLTLYILLIIPLFFRRLLVTEYFSIVVLQIYLKVKDMNTFMTL